MRSRHCDNSGQESVQQLSICIRSKRRHANFERISLSVGFSDSDTRAPVIVMAPPVVTRKLHNPEAKEICQGMLHRGICTHTEVMSSV
jgi:hypothetical protein